MTMHDEKLERLQKAVIEAALAWQAIYSGAEGDSCHARLTLSRSARALRDYTSNEILKSFDGRDWARAFVAHVAQNPAIATDEVIMTGWFANALMRGYDEHAKG